MKRKFILAKNIIVLLNLLVLLWPALTYAQDNYVLRGTVIDSLTNETIPFINIMEKGTSNGTLSDLDGNFSLVLETSAILKISAIGCKTKEVEITKEFLEKGMPLMVEISQLNFEIKVVKNGGGCKPPATIYPTIDLITAPEQHGMIGVCENKIDKDDYKQLEEMFLRPNEHQLRFFLMSNR